MSLTAYVDDQMRGNTRRAQPLYPSASLHTLTPKSILIPNDCPRTKTEITPPKNILQSLRVFGK